MKITALVLVLAACATETDGLDPDKGDQICRDTRYGDGVCQIDLGCGVPDIDCFLTFADDAEGARWFTGIEAQLAAALGRPPRTLHAGDDPRFAQLRALLDRGWSAYSAVMPVGFGLQLQRPALVVVDDPVANAFVIVDGVSQRAALAIMVHTGMLDHGIDDAGLLGMFLHELSHAARLHGVQGIGERMRSFYVAPDGFEPIGAVTPEVPVARDAGTRWRTAGADVGPYSDRELDGLPFGGELESVLRYVEAQGAATNPAGCGHAQQLLAELRAELAGSRDAIDGSLHVDRSDLAPRVATALAELRDGCLAAYSKRFVDVAAELAHATPQQIEAQLSLSDRVLVADRHVVDAIAALAGDRRATMRQAEADYIAATGLPWRTLRFFSSEEDADDSSEPALRALGMPPWGMAGALSGLLGDKASFCDQLLAAGFQPYGIDYVDDHHSTCWRIGHLHALASSTRARIVAPERRAKPPAPLRLHPPVLDTVIY
jgi:hypothetical protein